MVTIKKIILKYTEKKIKRELKWYTRKKNQTKKAVLEEFRNKKYIYV